MSTDVDIGVELARDCGCCCAGICLVLGCGWRLAWSFIFFGKRRMRSGRDAEIEDDEDDDDAMEQSIWTLR